MPTKKQTTTAPVEAPDIFALMEGAKEEMRRRLEEEALAQEERRQAEQQALWTMYEMDFPPDVRAALPDAAIDSHAFPSSIAFHVGEDRFTLIRQTLPAGNDFTWVLTKEQSGYRYIERGGDVGYTFLLALAELIDVA